MQYATAGPRAAALRIAISAEAQARRAEDEEAVVAVEEEADGVCSTTAIVVSTTETAVEVRGNLFLLKKE